MCLPDSRPAAPPMVPIPLAAGSLARDHHSQMFRPYLYTFILQSTPGDRSWGAGLLLMDSAASPFLRKWILCWFSVELSWHISTNSASLLHLYWPCVSAALLPARTCLIGGRRSHRGHRSALYPATGGDYGGRAECRMLP